MSRLYTIIVPIYNAGIYLENCIYSVLNQTYSNWQLILINDGSTDNSLEICENFKKQDIKNRILIIDKLNGGVVSARKCGCEYAVGDYIILLDSDDYLDLDALYTIDKKIGLYDENVEMVCFNNYNVFNDKIVNKINYVSDKFYSKSEIEKTIYNYVIEDKNSRYFSNSLWGKCIAKDLYCSYQQCAPENVKIAEDAAVIKCCLIATNNILVINNSLYYYRIHSKSVTHCKKAFPLFDAKINGKYLEDNINTQCYDFQLQICRFVVHNLFLAVKSQIKYNDKINNKVLKNVLIDEYYSMCIKCAKFKFLSKGFVAKMLLKYKMFFLIKIFR